jgi:hypothetical protein
VDGARQAAGDVDKVGRAADRAARSGGQLKSMLLGTFGAAGGIGAVMLAKKSLIDFNANLEGSKQTMAGLLMMNKGGTFETQFAVADGFVERMLIRAKETSATMSELSAMGRDVTAAVSAAGGSMLSLENITVGATVAAKALGREQGDAAREIGQMIGGRVESVDTFGRQLLRSVGFADYQKFNKLKESERLKLTEKALDQPALRAMAKAQSESFAGVTSTLEDNLQIALGKVGLPLMKEITAEVKQWNAWIDAHPEKIAALVKDVGKGLVDGFRAVKDAVMWISDNREVLMSLAKAALVMKGGSLVGDVLGGPFRALAGLRDSMSAAGGAANGFSGAMTSAAGRLAQIGNIVGAGASMAADFILRERDKAIGRQVSADSTVDFAAGVGTGRYAMPGARGLSSRIDDALASGVLKSGPGGFSVDRKRLAEGAGRGGEFMMSQHPLFGPGSPYVQSAKELKAEMQLLRLAQMDVAHRFQVGWQMAQTRMFEGLVQAATLTLTATERNRPKARDPGTTIKIAKVEVAAKDPDRWIQQLETETMKRARVPRRAKAALRGGGA